MRMIGTSKSSIANHVVEYVDGAWTIRAFGEEGRFFNKNLDLIDVNAGVFFHNFASTKWLIQRLEVIYAVVLASATLCIAMLPIGTFTSGETSIIVNIQTSMFEFPCNIMQGSYF